MNKKKRVRSSILFSVPASLLDGKGINSIPDVIDFIHAEALKQKKFGARPIIRLVQNDIEDLITDLMLENDYKPEYEFTATCKNDKIVIE